MALEWIWYFIWYSFLGFLLEVIPRHRQYRHFFAAFRHS